MTVGEDVFGVIEIPMTNTYDQEFVLILEGGDITPKEIWEQKEIWMKVVADSKEKWESMDTEKQEAVRRMVVSAVERMHDRIDDWIPESLEGVEGGDFIDIKIRLLFTDIDREIERHEQATSFQIKGAAEDLATTLSEFEGGTVST